MTIKKKKKKPKWNLEKIESKENYMKEVIKQKFDQMDLWYNHLNVAEKISCYDLIPNPHN